MQPDNGSGHILIVEDYKPIRTFMASTFREAGHAVTEAPTGKDAYACLRFRVYDLVLLDLKLDDVDGMEILKTIRRQDESTPVMIVSSTQDLDTKVCGFEVGCDDYVTKPFHAAELVGRARRLLRRSKRERSAPASDASRQPVQDRIETGPFSLDLRGFRVLKNGKPLDMRKKVFDLFLHFVKNPNVVLSKEALHRQAWPFEDEVNENSLYVHIHKLRSLIENDPAHPVHLRTVRGVGFKFTPGSTATL
jgi:two-component system, OmpR family, alkaline phosphatase synthesis response regulator PhoP